ncbi:GNAT family N-acetyltransferase [Mycolicibacterium neworleansense]|uniref:Acetyltransferase n=1 Tax=Mycolicibacterium neworleansense TaxID=146018 RepID=A0A0H5RP85_9MYCO|nr:GNAT family N-acetyltransferase [Mycolicibacterium neworleansense]MCV7364485.1 GNAT family N-acetyltransferase [Mycolicibacterium neworleansense]CRZ15272.1 acetyltransferase [Mycolicibacterium neworleansense]
MEAHLHQSLVDFEPAVRSVYRLDPVLFTLELTTVHTTPWPAERILLSVGNGKGVEGAAVQTRDSVLLVNGLPPRTAMAAAEAIAAFPAGLSGVRGTPATATAFMQAWRAVTGVQASESSRDVLYRLGRLTGPYDVAGEWRLAGTGDVETVVRWLNEFFIEAFGEPSNVDASRAMLTSIVDSGDHIVLWTIDGEPASMARVRAAVVGVSRIGPVYTPPGRRGRGYAAAVTAAAARFARDEGASEVVLFADTANPVSNRVYRRIGFEAIADDVRYTLAQP